MKKHRLVYFFRYVEDFHSAHGFFSFLAIMSHFFFVDELKMWLANHKQSKEIETGVNGNGIQNGDGVERQTRLAERMWSYVITHSSKPENENGRYSEYQGQEYAVWTWWRMEGHENRRKENVCRSEQNKQIHTG